MSTTSEKKPLLSTSLLGGLGLSGGLGVAAVQLTEHYGAVFGSGAVCPVSAVTVALLGGLAVGNGHERLVGAGGRPLAVALGRGLGVAKQTVLRAGIVLLGLKLSLVELWAFGGGCLPVVLTAVTSGVLGTLWLGSRLGLSRQLSSLLAAGTSICGVTAIASLSPVIGADARSQALAVANVAAFGTLGMVLLPELLLRAPALLSSSPQLLGYFLGTAIHDTSQVVGAALSYASRAGEPLVLSLATLTKLTRNAFLGLVLPLLGYYNNAAGPRAAPPKWSAVLPLFVLGFFAASAVRTVGDYLLADQDELRRRWRAAIALLGDQLGAKYLLCTALAAVGMSTSVSMFRGVGWRPFACGLGASVFVAGSSLAVLLAMNSAKTQ